MGSGPYVYLAQPIVFPLCRTCNRSMQIRGGVVKHVHQSHVQQMRTYYTYTITHIIIIITHNHIRAHTHTHTHPHTHPYDARHFMLFDAPSLLSSPIPPHQSVFAPAGGLLNVSADVLAKRLAAINVDLDKEATPVDTESLLKPKTVSHHRNAFLMRIGIGPHVPNK